MYLNMNGVTTELAVSLILNSPTFLLIEQGGFSPVIGHQKRYCSRAPREGAFVARKKDITVISADII
jgi:hypothetical protein